LVLTVTTTTTTWSRKHPKQQQFQGIAIGLMLYTMVPFSPWHDDHNRGFRRRNNAAPV